MYTCVHIMCIHVYVRVCTYYVCTCICTHVYLCILRRLGNVVEGMFLKLGLPRPGLTQEQSDHKSTRRAVFSVSVHAWKQHLLSSGCLQYQSIILLSLNHSSMHSLAMTGVCVFVYSHPYRIVGNFHMTNFRRYRGWPNIHEDKICELGIIVLPFSMVSQHL